MPKYMTKQRRALIDFLSSHTDEQFTARQIADALSGDGVSVSAVYRNLADMELDSTVKRCAKGGSREVYYQYTAAEKCSGCLHMTCRICGKTAHMNPRTAGILLAQAEMNDGFFIDMAETVIYGVCARCAQSD